jgi:preprotein translocase subunit SecG
MDEIRRVAVECVGRAVMFGSLAIGCVMVGFSFNPVSAFRSGAFLTLMMALVLMWKAMTASTKDPRRTEIWLYLDEKSRPIDDSARRVFGSVMRDVYGVFARLALSVAVGFFVLSLILMLFGLRGYIPPTG